MQYTPLINRHYGPETMRCQTRCSNKCRPNKKRPEKEVNNELPRSKLTRYQFRNSFSYALVMIWIFTVIYGYFQYFFLVINMNFDTVEFTSDVQTYPIILLVALFIWVLSHIFMKGCELQDEHELTV